MRQSAIDGERPTSPRSGVFFIPQNITASPTGMSASITHAATFTAVTIGMANKSTRADRVHRDVRHRERVQRELLFEVKARIEVVTQDRRLGGVERKIGHRRVMRGEHRRDDEPTPRRRRRTRRGARTTAISRGRDASFARATGPNPGGRSGGAISKRATVPAPRGFRYGSRPMTAKTASDVEARVARAVAALATAGFALAASWELFGPLLAGHYASSASVGIIADNMLRWHIPGPVWEYTATRPSPAAYYCHHPWGIFWMTAILRADLRPPRFRLPPRAGAPQRRDSTAPLRSRTDPLAPCGRSGRRGRVRRLADLARVRELQRARGPGDGVVDALSMGLREGDEPRRRQRQAPTHRPLPLRALHGARIRLACLSLGGRRPRVRVRAVALLEASLRPARPARQRCLEGLARAALRHVLARRDGDRRHRRSRSTLYAFHRSGKLGDLFGSAEMRSAGNAAPLAHVLESRRYWIELSFTPIAILLGKIGAFVCLARLFVLRKEHEFLPLAVLFMAVVQYVAFKQGADIHVFWPHHFALYFALAMGALVASLADVFDSSLSLLRRQKRAPRRRDARARRRARSARLRAARRRTRARLCARDRRALQRERPPHRFGRRQRRPLPIGSLRSSAPSAVVEMHESMRGTWALVWTLRRPRRRPKQADTDRAARARRRLPRRLAFSLRRRVRETRLALPHPRGRPVLGGRRRRGGGAR